jgi:2Fe-2S ferredoxin
MLALNVMGDCGGQCICASCHVHIDPPLNTPMKNDEKLTLDIERDVGYNSRLSCQVVVDDDLQDKTVRVINNAILY